MEKQLGKIKSVAFGFGGYQMSQLGLWVEITGPSWDVSTSINGGWSTRIAWDENRAWTENEREIKWLVMLRRLQSLLESAKVEDVHSLLGKPVEVIFEKGVLKSWRILSEVL